MEKKYGTAAGMWAIKMNRDPDLKLCLLVFLEVSTGSIKHDVLTPRDLSFLTFPVFRVSLFILTSFCGRVMVAFTIPPCPNLRPLGNTLVHCRYVRPGGGFVPSFQLFEKGDVNGEHEQKVFTFLKVSAHTPGRRWS